jgi:quercetin dioxygenase-like cupin family protein
MPIPHAKPGDIVDLRPLGRALATAKTTTLVKTADLELIRLVLSAGKELPTHKVPGEITVQCLEGRVAFTAEGKTQELTAGQLLYLTAGERHAVKGIEDSSLLVTILLPKDKPQPFDVVQESSEESFPASDPPADHRH